jgi:hypothetical protein
VASYIVLNQVARTPYGEELITIPVTVVKPQAIFATKNYSMMARCRLELGPVRYGYTTLPTATTGMYLQPGDILELSHTELQALFDTGGFIRDSSAGADAKLWCHYYR